MSNHGIVQPQNPPVRFRDFWLLEVTVPLLRQMSLGTRLPFMPIRVLLLTSQANHCRLARTLPGLCKWSQVFQRAAGSFHVSWWRVHIAGFDLFSPRQNPMSHILALAEATLYDAERACSEACDSVRGPPKVALRTRFGNGSLVHILGNHPADS